MMQIDWWSWKCARCDWTARSEFTVNPQQVVAEMRVRRHIQAHESAESSDARLTDSEKGTAIGSAEKASS